MPVVSTNQIELAYDEVGDQGAPAILLVMGLGTQMTAWSEEFCRSLAGRGFRVLRFDNRDVGLSSKIETAKPVAIAAAFASLMTGKPVEAPYTLDDMAADTVGLMDGLGLRQVHLVGASMGGMIAQIIAAKHADRVSSLTSIMSSSGAPGLPQAKPEAISALLAPRPASEDREQAIDHGVKVYRVIGSPGFPTSDADLRVRIGRAVDRSYYPAGVGRQFVAVLAGGSRVELLKRIVAPTLVIHGADDPLVPVEAGIDTARHIPDAALKVIPGMGHDLAAGLVPILVDAIAAHCQAVAHVR
ncbi:alpha/beta fold hydrolase [Phreatobacter stygius]|uniref:Alpha/beta hydrolase n=1 Tax=Phreatobacter stygius TaxID=1940610 RepID=A0A4D7B7I8_9HYPH|nr:alpha/beta hydrolase [Phreatobacter stygius]QCI63857.1 alpha/beta hydrolase [Phreatobacter stygius]